MSIQELYYAMIDLEDKLPHRISRVPLLRLILLVEITTSSIFLWPFVVILKHHIGKFASLTFPSIDSIVSELLARVDMS